MTICSEPPASTRPARRQDIQGLRMVAVLSVFACHLWGWPRGGFAGVDVFFVISGFLITGNLLRSAERHGKASLGTFYRNRARRILPAAVVVLILTHLVAVGVFTPLRSEQIAGDVVSAFFSLANWHFAERATDYFAAGQLVSPVQHYWSLSVEEQFYLGWPAVLVVVGLLIVRHPRARSLPTGIVAGLVVVASFVWAVIATADNATWAYFDTRARAWELGVGALLAAAHAALTRIPIVVRPILSWAGLALIAASLFVVAENSARFSATWALLPVSGAALVVAAGVGGEPGCQPLLRNPVASYLGDISYSLYLVHWPVIVILAAVAPAGVYSSLTAVAMSFGLAILSYQFVENPLRRIDPSGAAVTRIPVARWGTAGAAFLMLIGLCTLVIRPYSEESFEPRPVVSASHLESVSPLQLEIISALQATEWPRLNPTVEAVTRGLPAVPELWRCGLVPRPADQSCAVGRTAAPIQLVLVGDSIAMTYAGALRQIALDSEGRVQVRIEAQYGCPFSEAAGARPDPRLVSECRAHNEHTLGVINTGGPKVVIVSNYYGGRFGLGDDGAPPPADRAVSLSRMAGRIHGSKVLILAAPPNDKDIRVCYSVRRSAPRDCVSQVSALWREIAAAERIAAEMLSAVWVDSRPWFCSGGGSCPSFVGTIPVKFDRDHMTPDYARKIAPAIADALRQVGVL